MIAWDCAAIIYLECFTWNVIIGVLPHVSRETISDLTSRSTWNGKPKNPLFSGIFEWFGLYYNNFRAFSMYDFIETFLILHLNFFDSNVSHKFIWFFTVSRLNYIFQIYTSAILSNLLRTYSCALWP